MYQLINLNVPIFEDKTTLSTSYLFIVKKLTFF